MTEHPERTVHKGRPRESFTPSYEAFHEVYIYKGPGSGEERGSDSFYRQTHHRF